LTLQGEVGHSARPQIVTLRSEINTLLEQEDLWWMQRSKEAWLKDGDKNTKYFHACANQKRRKSCIDRILDEHGCLCESSEEIGNAFTYYYTSLFTTKNLGDVDECLQDIEGRLSHEMNEKLMREFTSEEVGAALKLMSPLKAPGFDGFSAGFYQGKLLFTPLKYSPIFTFTSKV
jgi:hypothetical protein